MLPLIYARLPEAHGAEDCCGDVSQLAHDNAMRRVVQPARSQ